MAKSTKSASKPKIHPLAKHLIGKPKAVHSTNKVIKAPNVHATMAKLTTTFSKKAEGITKIKTQGEYDAVAMVVKNITDAEKQVKEQRAKEVDPIEQGLNEIKSRYREWSDKLAAAKLELKALMITFINKKAAKQEVLQEKFESGSISFSKFSSASVAVDTSGSGARKIDHFEITDEARVPREYCSPDMAKIKAAHKAGKVIPGVTVSKKTSIAVR
jgi:hypothetical protein